MTLEEIKNKLQEIIDKLSSDENLTEEEIQELENKANELEEEKKSLIAQAEKRKTTLDKIKRGISGATWIVNSLLYKLNVERFILHRSKII